MISKNFAFCAKSSSLALSVCSAALSLESTKLLNLSSKFKSLASEPEIFGSTDFDLSCKAARLSTFCADEILSFISLSKASLTPSRL